jgi:hypothetical protein
MCGPLSRGTERLVGNLDLASDPWTEVLPQCTEPIVAGMTKQSSSTLALRDVTR